MLSTILFGFQNKSLENPPKIWLNSKSEIGMRKDLLFVFQNGSPIRRTTKKRETNEWMY